MKKLILLSLAIFGGAALRAAEPANSSKREELFARVQASEGALQEFMLRPTTAIPERVLRTARAIVITNQFKAGFLFAFKGGYGVMLVKKPNGRWSIPVLLNANEASIGLQAGANSIQTVYIFTDDATPRLLFTRRLNFGVDAKAVAGPRVAESEKNTNPIIDAPVLVYTRTMGLFAGATVKAGQISRNDDANFILYDTKYRMPELLYSDWVKPPAEVQSLMNYMQKLAP